jgi:hypothetical protein
MTHTPGPIGHDPMAMKALVSRIDDDLARHRLIAAAPDLLAALKYALTVLDSYSTTNVGIHCAAIDIARAAIAKAEGK